ncbi:peptidase M28 [Salegentibacter salinarum]|uniref:Carboxypeptidase Q n=1 Tax=Salegentibacter salinarum TaxID=447422 RepID=A0A2N0U3A6_9FLAO|nr:M20/M25/M40 family metallo-hydrolase [Salegentibacter salinarum]PKD21490.1 peptidase M28 [Salegentibacter salinarum]SKB37764.1 Zn-dependent amino-or carboxypeptidase, M28 family [Salegentibacter salinarum]
MKKNLRTLFSLFLVVGALQVQAQEEMVDKIVNEANENSKLEDLAHELVDVVGPRLVGTPQMKNAHDWAVKKYDSWGISAENEEYGTWRGWERGITHIDLVEPRVRTLQGRQLAWSPSTGKKGVTAEVVLLPEASDSTDFANMLSLVKGKFVMISVNEPTGRPPYNWEEWGTEKSWKKMQGSIKETDSLWRDRIGKTGYGYRELPKALENAGAVGIITSNWSHGFGANKVFGGYTSEIPTLDINLEDYGLLYRLAENDNAPKLKVVAQSKDLGEMPTFNTIARIEGSEKPEEYIILSAHFDSWDGGTGATDNGTGTIVMMETMRILKKLYPNPKRTIIAGHWGGEEQGLNGSRAFVKDNPEIVANVQALFNQDNGTGRVKNINGQGFLHAYDYIRRWLEPVPQEIKGEIETSFPGTPSSGGTDHASFVAAGAPAFMLNSLNWSYWDYTWHTNLDTYDKIVFDDVRSNVILTAIMTYMASEDPETTSREKAVLPISRRSGEQMTWPEPRDAERKGGLD